MRFKFHLLLILFVLGTTLPNLAFVSKRVSETGAFLFYNVDDPPFGIPRTVFNPSTKALIFSFAEDAFSEENREAELNALRAAFGQWQAIPHSKLRFEEGPLVPAGTDINREDGTNVVFWAKNSTLVNGEMTDIRGRLGLAFTLFFADGRMIASDIVLNGVEHDWYADPGEPVPNARLIEGTTIHEIGHSIGLEHSPIGGATMFARDGDGNGFQIGLTPDEFAFVQTFYGDGNEDNLATIEGTITADGVGVMGAMVLLETPDGAVFSGTASLTESPKNITGHYELVGIPAGNYQLRIEPFDPAGSPQTLVTGRDISLFRFGDAMTDFQPTEPQAINVNVGDSLTVDFELDPTPPAFRIERIRQFTENPLSIRIGNSPVVMIQGQSDLVVGVFGTDLPTENVELTVSGDGLSLGETEITTQFFGGLPHISRRISVADDATPGLRNFIVRRGSDIAYATGFVEIRAKETDYNFDGLDDSFQRSFFAPFTSDDAAPSADPDSDGFTNAEEADAGTDPTEFNETLAPPITVSPFPILSVVLSAAGATVTIDSTEGARYQLYTRADVGSGGWTAIGNPVTGTGTPLTITDSTATDDIRFYEVRTAE